jgi:nicotinate dehydrogenase subunit A
MPTRIVVNGREHEVEARGETRLLQVLRNDIGLNGPKYGCGLAECGACTVLVAGRPARACVMPLAALRGRPVTTLEGLARDGLLHPVQQAFVEGQGAQCGYCLNGMIMTTVALLDAIPEPDETQVLAALKHNLCRCGTHAQILESVRLAIRKMRDARVAARQDKTQGAPHV